MKLTILSRCFSKLKRIVLTLFAALCAGSVWAASPTVYLEASCSLSAQGVISVHDSFAYFGQKSGRTFTTKVSYKINDGEIKTVTLNTTDTLKPASTDSDDAIWISGDYTTNVEGFVPGDVVWVKYQLVYSGDVGGKTSQSKEYTFDTNGVVESAGSWAFSPNRFLVTGTVPVGKGIESIKIRYALNSDLFSNKDATTETLLALETAQVNTVSVDAQGKFVFEIPFPGEHSTLVWSLWAVFDDGTEKLYINAVEETSLLKMERKEGVYVEYTWNGNGGNDAWDNPLNWTMEGLGWGFPGLVNGNIDGVYVAGTDGARSTVCFAGNADIDLGGKTYDFYEQDDKASAKNTPFRGLEFEKPSDLETMRVVLRNGTLGTKVPSGYGPHLLGAAGVELEFNNATFKVRGDTNYLVPNANSTIIFSGTRNHDWYLYSRDAYSQNSRLIFNNFVGYTFKSTAHTVPNGSAVELTNSIWKVRVGTKVEHAMDGLAKRIVFRDGNDRQSQMRVVYYASSDDHYANINLKDTYDIKIPAAGHEDASIFARNLTAAPTGTFEIDVTDYVPGERVPLVELTGTPAYTTLPKLVAKANGVDVTDARNAKLVWDGNFMYYQQDSQNAASIGTTEYATLGAAVEAATSGATITVLNDCTADTACVIANKTLTIDLNGKTVKANDTAATTDGNGVFWVQAGGVLTLEDSSEDKSGTVDGNGGNDYKMAIWADGGKVVINAGNYVNENDGTHTQYDLIYAKNGGEIVINGGTFKCDTPRWTLNSHNTQTGTFVVTGGKFYQYNPTDFDTDEAVTTWCDAKYRAEADGDWYVIKEGYTVTTEPEASAVTVTADTETEALAQVDFSVTAPEGVDATVYENYFKLVATETAEGSKTWIVALALKDELKPVIAETTPAITFNDDGTITVNIENKLPGLNYGVRYATTVEAVETATPVAGFTVTPAEGDTAGFFKVVVDFKPIGETETN